MRPKPTRTTFTALAVASVLACAACTATSTGTDPGTSPTSSGPAAPVTDETALTFVGADQGGAADASSAPVRIGYVNQDNGVPSFPENTVAAKAAVAYINAKLGGIQGHPVELVACPVSSEAQGQSCGQQMLNDPTIQVVQTGALTVGNASLYNTLAGAKPIMGGNPTAPADFTAKNAYFYSPGSTGVNGAVATYIASTLKATAVSVVHSDDPGASTASQISVAAMKAAGLSPKDVSFPSSGGDLTGPLVASGAQTSEVIQFLSAGPACLQMAQAQKQLGLTATVISSGLCLDPSVKEQLGDYAQWTYGTSYPNVYSDGSDPQVNLYRSVMLAAGGADTNVGGFAPVVFGSLIDLVKVLDTVGFDNLTAASIGAALAAYTGASFLGAPDIACRPDSATPTVCTSSARIIAYKGNGTWTDADGGSWIAAKS